MSEMYARHNGTMQDMLRIIKTAADWQATHIVLVGAHNLAALAPELHRRWDEYQIPMSVAVGLGEDVDRDALMQPPFVGLRSLSTTVKGLLEDHEAVIDNQLLRQVRAVPMSDLV